VFFFLKKKKKKKNDMTVLFFLLEETINSLRFGSRCKLISNEASVNRLYTNAELMALVKKLKEENESLRKGLMTLPTATESETNLGVDDQGDEESRTKGTSESRRNLEVTNDDLTDQLKTLQDQNEKLRKQLQTTQLQIQETMQSKSVKNEEITKQEETASRNLLMAQARVKELEVSLHRADQANRKLTQAYQLLRNSFDQLKTEMNQVQEDKKQNLEQMSIQLQKYKKHNMA
ncbi:hypothetical protein RFI_11677, partial [Reticulomyxa filosa]